MMRNLVEKSVIPYPIFKLCAYSRRDCDNLAVNKNTIYLSIKHLYGRHKE